MTKLEPKNCRKRQAENKKIKLSRENNTHGNENAQKLFVGKSKMERKKRGTNERTKLMSGERRIRATAGLDGSQLSDVQSRAHNIIVV